MVTKWRVSFSCRKDPLWTEHCKSHYLEPCGTGTAAAAANRNSRCSQPSGSVRCVRRLHFRKAAKSTGQCKLRAVAWSWINVLNLLCIVCWLFFLLISIIITFYLSIKRPWLHNCLKSDTCSAYGGEERRILGFWWGNLRERHHLGDPGVDGRIIFKWFFGKRGVGYGLDRVVGTF
jgi:hypothetical protein